MLSREVIFLLILFCPFSGLSFHYHADARLDDVAAVLWRRTYFYISRVQLRCTDHVTFPSEIEYFYELCILNSL